MKYGVRSIGKFGEEIDLNICLPEAVISTEPSADGRAGPEQLVSDFREKRTFIPRNFP